jgi:hypothetical protein
MTSQTCTVAEEFVSPRGGDKLFPAVLREPARLMLEAGRTRRGVPAKNPEDGGTGVRECVTAWHTA